MTIAPRSDGATVPDPLEQWRATPVPGHEDMIVEPYYHWQLAVLSVLHRMPWVRFLWLKGGRRVRKTDLLLKRLIQKVMRRPPGSEVAYINRTIKQAKATAWRRLKRRFQYPNNWLLEGQPNENALEIPLLGGRLIRLLGSEDPSSHRGLELSDAAVDEASVNEHLAELQAEALEPMVADKNGTIDYSFTSRGKGLHFQQHRLGEASNPQREEKYQEYLSFTIPQSKVGSIPPSESERYRQQNGDDIWGQEYECVDLDYVGLAVHQFTRAAAPEGNILPKLWYFGLKPFLTYFASVDYARSSGTTVREVWGVDQNGRIVFVEEMALPGGDPLRVAAQIKQQDLRLGVHVLVNVCGRDCWHKESSGKAMAEQLISRGVPCIQCSFSLVDAVKVLNQACREIQEAEYDPIGDGLPMLLIVEGECPKLQYQMSMVEHQDLEKKSQNFKDALDCARMAVMQNYRAHPTTRQPIGGIHRGRIEEVLRLAGGQHGGGRRRHPISGRVL